LIIQFNSTGVFNQGNVFSAQLSDANGNFINPTTIGSIISTSPGSISATIPNNTPFGTGYRIRIVSSNPQDTSSDNGTNLTISANPDASVNASGPLTFCSGSSVTLSVTAGAGNTYQWFKDNVQISAAINNSYNVTSSGFYNVAVLNSFGCASSSSMLNVTVHPVPLASVTASKNTICQGETSTLTAQHQTGNSYQWKWNGSNVTGSNSSTFIANTGGDYSVEVTDSNGCTSTSSIQNIMVNPKPSAQVTPMGATTLCSGQSVNLNAVTTTGYQHSWLKDGNIIPQQNTSNLNVTNTGTYRGIVENLEGCRDTSTAINVTVNPKPSGSLIASGQTEFCQGDSVILEASPAVEFNFWIMNGMATGSSNPARTVKTTGSFEAVFTNSYGCSDTTQAVNVVVNPIPAVPVITQNQNTLISTPADGYQWYFSGILLTGANSQILVPVAEGVYFVEVSSSKGCKSISENLVFKFIGIKKAGSKHKFNVSPNPTTGLITVNIPDHQKEYSIDVIGITGTILFTQPVLNDIEKINLSEFPQGVYFLILRNEKQVVNSIKILKLN
jgi:hypothetical protein